jgi:hypothetical protein
MRLEEEKSERGEEKRGRKNQRGLAWSGRLMSFLTAQAFQGMMCSLLALTFRRGAKRNHVNDRASEHCHRTGKHQITSDSLVPPRSASNSYDVWSASICCCGNGAPVLTVAANLSLGDPRMFARE